MSLSRFLNETGIEYHRPTVVFLTEDAQLKVADDILTKMFKFITDKYNSIDFGEIEKSAGDISRFKYASVVEENANILISIYTNSADDGAEKYTKVARAVLGVLDYLRSNRVQMSTLYKSGNGVIQLLYTSMVASTMYATSALVSNTIRFVTTDQNADCQVLYDEIPGSVRHIYIRNVLSVHKNLNDITKLMNEFSKNLNRRASNVNESVAVALAVGAIVVGVIYMLPKIVTLIREIIYSIYFTRVKFNDMLDMQVKLLRTNIESLEAGRGSKKVIARQKKIAEDLERWKDRVAVRIDSVDAAVQKQKQVENKSLAVDKDTAKAFDTDDTVTGIMI